MPSEQKKCINCGRDFIVLDKEQAFYQRKSLPWPSECPKCRQDARLALRNERNLYRRNCNKCNEPMISPYKPDSPYTIYCQKCFWDYVA